MGQARPGNFFGLGAYDTTIFPMVANSGFLTHAQLVKKDDGVYLEIRMDGKWLKTQRKLVATDLLGIAEHPNLPFVQSDGTPYLLDFDYTGKKRNNQNPAPGPFEEIEDGLMYIKVW